MSPIFWQLLETLPKSSTQFIEVNTNGLLLTAANVERILASPLGRINVSLDAARPDTYRKIRGASFEKVTDNLAALVRRRAERGSLAPAIHINMTLMRENVDELPDFVRLGARLRIDSVDAWHLVQGEVAGNDPAWAIEHGGWLFNYREQHLSRVPAISNRAVRTALDLARHLGVAFVERPDLWLPE
jgi:MoaA/NifB/PqqE/SkfB family radical SAM enzyme